MLLNPVDFKICHKYSNVVIQYVAIMVRMSCLVLATLHPSAVSAQISHSIWAQTPFIKVMLYTTLKGIRSHGCSEVIHIFLAIPISQIFDEFFQ